MSVELLRIKRDLNERESIEREFERVVSKFKLQTPD